ncbi:DUF2157 domain-containing protein [uncultured Maricaulis sp.]|uniref:DUF2157 domain-containing protein n=1 Tax=uncultured Maricaulis sp. TaxID=174710 RepID=UPI0030DDD94A|tara:strand:+ start:1825 stop:3147 length:1323 start_codon:yes stop_codon:yes gene_type:complete
MGYRARLARDLERWIAAGWVEASHRPAILGDVAAQPGRWNAAGALAILGATLLAMSALSFVAANWDAMPRLLRFATIILALWASLLGAGRAFDRKAPVIGHALALLGAALFGAAIMLTAQTFNLTSFRNTAVLIWAVAAGGIALTLPSRPVLILATGLGALWAGLEALNPYAPGAAVWAYLPVWGVTAVLAHRIGSRVALNLLAPALFLWIAHLLWTQAAADRIGELEAFSAAILIAAKIGLIAAWGRDRGIDGGGILAGWGVALAVLGAHLLQWPLDETTLNDAGSGSGLYVAIAVVSLLVIAAIAWRRVADGTASRNAALTYLAAGLVAASIPWLVEAATPGGLIAVRILVGAVFYALCVAMIVQGTRPGQSLVGGIGISGFVLQTLYVYAETFSGLLDTALFFLVGGAILFLLSLGMLRLRRMRAAALPAVDSEDAS